MFAEIINQFEPITLGEMDNVKLLNRTDKKFMLTLNQLENWLKTILPDYRILEINGNRINSYYSYYFDTPEYDLYKAHHNKKLNRLKIRFRSYVESGIHFLEIKSKTNKGRTIKNRIDVATPNVISENEKKFILQFFKSSKPLFNSINISYHRVTLVNKIIPERVTIDLNLTFTDGLMERKLEKIAIVEIKQDNIKHPTAAEISLKNMHIKEGFISKYCLGMAMLKPVKQNLFKPVIRKILKTNTYA